MAKRIRTMVEFLGGATADDLAELDAEIATKRAAIDAAIAQAEKELKPLIELRKVLDLRINGKKPRKKPERKEKAGLNSGGSVRDRAYAILAKSGGPVKPALIASQLNCSVRAITSGSPEARKATRSPKGSRQANRSGKRWERERRWVA